MLLIVIKLIISITRHDRWTIFPQETKVEGAYIKRSSICVKLLEISYKDKCILPILCMAVSATEQTII